ncbi:hypothetical protein ACFLFF_13695 [Brevibacillus reuszeri]|uniref:hypothetical protein n=1 Tax=Brevibacillus reuszeri TaxID=54915 RepID=UPI001BB42F5C|nr:hypothetical protein [Brevibacillus reuszeri]
MNEISKLAYKKLIYQAFLDMKNSGIYSEVNFERNFRLAHVFHNLAESMLHDFEGFDEEAFWRAMDLLADHYQLHHYRIIFNEATKQT